MIDTHTAPASIVVNSSSRNSPAEHWTPNGRGSTPLSPMTTCVDNSTAGAQVGSAARGQMPAATNADATIPSHRRLATDGPPPPSFTSPCVCDDLRGLSPGRCPHLQRPQVHRSGFVTTITTRPPAPSRSPPARCLIAGKVRQVFQATHTVGRGWHDPSSPSSTSAHLPAVPLSAKPRVPRSMRSAAGAHAAGEAYHVGPLHLRPRVATHRGRACNVVGTAALVARGLGPGDAL
jgi:hypothetical protein